MKTSHFLGNSLIAGAFAAAVVSVAAVPASAAEVDGVKDPLRVVKIRQGEPIVVGVYEVMSGPDTALGLDQYRGIQVAAEEADNKIAGHPVRFIAEDTACTAEGGQTAATKIAADAKTVIALGGSCSSATTPAAPILWQAGIPNIGTSPSSPALTAPDRDAQYNGFLRTVYNDKWAGAETAKWAYNVQGYRNVATIHDGSPYAQKLVAVFEESFKKLGGTVCSAEAISPTDVDMRPVLTRIATCHPEMIYMPDFVAATAYLLRQRPEIAGLEKTVMIGSDASFGAQLVESAGKDVIGYKITTTAQEVEALGDAYPTMREKYKEMFGEYPIQGFHTDAYDAYNMAKAAIEDVAIKKDGNTYIPIMALRDRLFATKDFQGVSGTLTCDEHGDCAAYHFAIYQFVNNDKDTLEMGKNPKRIYPDKFK